MRYLLLLTVLITGPAWSADCPALLDHQFRKLASSDLQSLCDNHAGKVLLIVNTASFCGFTPQYKGLEALYQRYRQQGLDVVGFPSNDFSQEPGNEDSIREFCDLTYDVKFPMYEKIHVRQGSGTHPFIDQLADVSGSYPQWNFHKYLISRDGNQVISFSTRTRPDDQQLIEAIEKMLNDT